MARISTGTIDGLYLELVTASLSRHSLVTSLDETTTAAVRDILNQALVDVTARLGADTDQTPRRQRPDPSPVELD